MKNSLVSIVIPTFNSEKTIELCLKSIRSQTYKNTEIIVVDNNSHDNTIRISKKYTKKIFVCIGERSKQRNSGFKKAKGEIYCYLDSDMVLSRNVIEDAVKVMHKNKKYIALYIPEIVEGNNFLSRILNFERSFYDKTVIDAVRIIKKDVFNKLHGFDENLIAAEDWDLDRRVHTVGQVSIDVSPLYHLQYGLTLGKYLSKKRYYSEVIDRYIKKWGKNDEIIKKQLGLKYRFINIFVENKKWRKIVAHPFYFLCAIVLKIISSFYFLIIILVKKSYDD